MKPKDLVGNYVAYDSEKGSVWAEIDELRKQPDGRRFFIAKHMRVRTEEGRIIEHYNRVLWWDGLKKGKFVVVKPDDNLKEIEDELFMFLLRDTTDFNSFFLGAEDLEGMIDPTLSEKIQNTIEHLLNKGKMLVSCGDDNESEEEE